MEWLFGFLVLMALVGYFQKNAGNGKKMADKTRIPPAWAERKERPQEAAPARQSTSAVMLQNGDAMYHLETARRAERQGDFLATRMGYLKCMETLRQARDEAGTQEAQKEYDAFVQRDPFFKELVSSLLPIIQANPGILQSDITKRVESVDWSALYNSNRPVAKEDIYYALYFADKFGQIVRTKKGRSYELRVSG